MGEPRFTKGPWEVERYVVDADEREVSPWSRGDLKERLRIVDADGSGLIVADIIACSHCDAHLIAVAPELYKEHDRDLDTLAEIRAALDKGRMPVHFEAIQLLDDMVKAKHAALAKARGEKP